MQYQSKLALAYVWLPLKENYTSFKGFVITKNCVLYAGLVQAERNPEIGKQLYMFTASQADISWKNRIGTPKNTYYVTVKEVEKENHGWSPYK